MEVMGTKAAENLLITVIVIDRTTNKWIPYKHVNFHLSLSARNVGSHCSTKGPTSKHHNLKAK